MNSLILAAAVMYPLIHNAWNGGPLPQSFAVIPSAPYVIDAPGLAVQKELYLKQEDPIIRSSIARDLANSNNPEGVKLLEELLKLEKNQLTREDLLLSLVRLEKEAPVSKPEGLKELLKSADPMERAYAAALFVNASLDATPVLDMLLAEQSAFVQNFLWPRLLAAKGKCTEKALEKLFEAKSHFGRAGAAQLLASGKDDPDSIPILAKAVADPNLFVRLSLASILAARDAGGDKLLETLSSDAGIPVRAAAASLKLGSDGRVKLALKLSSDSDQGVRRAACESLASCKSEDSVNALIARLGDSDRFVRTAAENSLGAIKPGPEALAKIEDALEPKASQGAAIRALGLTDSVPSSPKILALLEKSSDDDISIRCVDALGRLLHKPAAKAVAAKASSPNPELRRSVAATLGLLKEKEGYEALMKLSKDLDLKTAIEALKSMGLIADSSFNGTLVSVMAEVKNEGDRRAAACWAIARTGSLDAKAIAQLRILAIELCIPIPMSSEKAYDADNVRASSLLAMLANAKRGDAAAEKTFEECDKKFKDPFAKMSSKGMPLSNKLMEDYIRQINLIREGSEPGPAEVPPATPELTERKL